MSETIDNQSELKAPSKRTPNPGSAEAVRLGCTCPRLDNGHGRGYLGKSDVFVYTENCPVHCKPE